MWGRKPPGGGSRPDVRPRTDARRCGTSCREHARTRRPVKAESPRREGRPEGNVAPKGKDAREGKAGSNSCTPLWWSCGGQRATCCRCGQRCLEPGGNDAGGNVDGDADCGHPGVQVVVAVHVAGEDRRDVGGLDWGWCRWRQRSAQEQTPADARRAVESTRERGGRLRQSRPEGNVAPRGTSPRREGCP